MLLDVDKLYYWNETVLLVELSEIDEMGPRNSSAITDGRVITPAKACCLNLRVANLCNGYTTDCDDRTVKDITMQDLSIKAPTPALS